MNKLFFFSAIILIVLVWFISRSKINDSTLYDDIDIEICNEYDTTLTEHPYILKPQFSSVNKFSTFTNTLHYD